jgi:predicted DNA binding CopG/RHH family protein
MEKQMSTSKIPQTDSIEELAKFWDTHDVTEFEGELEEVTEPVFEQKTETTVTIQLHSREAEALRQMAQSKGLPQTTLLRAWVLEKLQGT